MCMGFKLKKDGEDNITKLTSKKNQGEHFDPNMACSSTLRACGCTLGRGAYQGQAINSSLTKGEGGQPVLVIPVGTKLVIRECEMYHLSPNIR